MANRNKLRRYDAIEEGYNFVKFTSVIVVGILLAIGIWWHISKGVKNVKGLLLNPLIISAMLSCFACLLLFTLSKSFSEYIHKLKVGEICNFLGYGEGYAQGIEKLSLSLLSSTPDQLDIKYPVAKGVSNQSREPHERYVVLSLSAKNIEKGIIDASAKKKATYAIKRASEIIALCPEMGDSASGNQGADHAVISAAKHHGLIESIAEAINTGRCPKALDILNYKPGYSEYSIAQILLAQIGEEAIESLRQNASQMHSDNPQQLIQSATSSAQPAGIMK